VSEVTFYATAAQVIPVLALALLVERRLFFERSDHLSVSVTLYALSVLIILVGGELVALNAVLSGGSSVALAVTMAALTWGLLFLFASAFHRQIAALSRAAPRWVRRIAEPGLLILAVVMVATIMLTGRGEVVLAIVVFVAWTGVLVAAAVQGQREDRRARGPDGDSNEERD